MEYEDIISEMDQTDRLLSEARSEAVRKMNFYSQMAAVCDFIIDMGENIKNQPYQVTPANLFQYKGFALGVRDAIKTENINRIFEEYRKGFANVISNIEPTIELFKSRISKEDISNLRKYKAELESLLSQYDKYMEEGMPITVFIDLNNKVGVISDKINSIGR